VPAGTTSLIVLDDPGDETGVAWDEQASDVSPGNSFRGGVGVMLYARNTTASPIDLIFEADSYGAEIQVLRVTIPGSGTEHGVRIIGPFPPGRFLNHTTTDATKDGHVFVRQASGADGALQLSPFRLQFTLTSTGGVRAYPDGTSPVDGDKFGTASSSTVSTTSADGTVDSGTAGWDGASAIDEGSTWEALQVVETVAADADMTNVAADLTINSLLVTPSFSYAKRSHASSLTINAAAMAELVGAADDARPLLVVLDAPSVTFSESATIPRRPFVRFYVTGTATISEGVTLTARGANHSATGSDLTAVEIRDITGTFGGVSNPSVPAAGGAGGAASGSTTANPGAAGTGGGTGGGSSGCRSGGSSTAGAGAAGTAYSGGPAGGSTRASAVDSEAGAARGGKGGDGEIGEASLRGAGGGAGNPTGAAATVGAGSVDGVQDWTGGNFALFCIALAGAGTITAPGGNGADLTGFGTAGSSGSAGGSGSGGGTVSAYAESSTFTGALAAPGGAGGSGGNGNGGAGGLGTARELVGTLP
jgi:hypothetical protein